ncbi:tetratricopeptide repeat protein [Belnapia sp. T6]|uniref:Tetratricopeptide repeat protein n=1 Tax=Belnapia mucosa TaxID=2804532 RepID=A0ABS1VAR8_9PROT|nr:tetratricopeptide repeat protein [Belnapia mucosa]MBL6457433.1 tetratricopeptide repeat protein [Belnapia mucosa]
MTNARSGGRSRLPARLPPGSQPPPRAPLRADAIAGLEAMGRLPEALDARRAAVLSAPSDAGARIALGSLLLRLGRHEAAVTVLRAAIGLAPDRAAAHRALGLALGRLRYKAEAEAALSTAVLLDPAEAGARNDLGALLAEQGRHAEAVEAFRAALVLDPGSADACANLCASLGTLNRIDEAVAAGKAAVRLRPDHANAQINLGVILAHLGRHTDAIDAFQAAIRLRPEHANAHANLGLALGSLGRFEDALATLRGAVRLQPGHAIARQNLAMTLLLLGRLEEGFAEYEHRLPPRPPGLPPGPPPWRGEPLAGRTILLHAEQGLGDTIQFVRYLPEVARRGAGRVLLAAPPAFARLLAGLPGLDALQRPGESPARTHLQCSLLSLPYACGTTTLESIPAPIPYLRAEPAALPRWRERLAGLPGPLRVGLVWAGNPEHRNDRHRSIASHQLAPLWAVAGVSWVSLQVGARAAALRGEAPNGAVLDLAPELTDLAETAAAMAQLDLVVTVDTAAAHLAGALGRPVWTMLPALPDWRWLLEREDTPWYPTMRLFRQTRFGDWSGVVERVAGALQQMVAAP